MTVSQKNIVPGVLLTGALTTLYTAPAGTRARICNASACNDTAGVVNLTVHVVASGGAAGSANKRISARPLAVNETYNCSELIGKILEPGDFIQGMGLNLSLDISAFTQV